MHIESFNHILNKLDISPKVLKMKFVIFFGVFLMALTSFLGVEAGLEEISVGDESVGVGGIPGKNLFLWSYSIKFLFYTN